MKNCITKLLSSSVLICCFWSYSKEDTGATYNKHIYQDTLVQSLQLLKNKFSRINSTNTKLVSRKFVLKFNK